MRDTRADLTLASGGGRTPFLTYEPYYGLKEKPFSLSSDPRFLYKSRAHAAVYDEIRAGIRRREGIVVLTGDIGTGKTTLCRGVLRDLDRKTFSTFLPDPFVTREDLLKMVLIDFGVMSVDDLKSGRLAGASRPELSYPLYDFLKTLVPLQAFAVLVIDEAQNLPLPLLEEIRILSDLEGPEKLLQVVLIGQLELLPKLKDPAMRQLDQRVSVRCSLDALDRESVGGYIAHRLEVAGGGSDRVTFTSDAIDTIHAGTHGNPRLINLVCDKALYRGSQARTFSIDGEIARHALAELGITKLTPPPVPPVDFGLDTLMVAADSALETADAQPLPPSEPDAEPAPPPHRVFDSARIVAVPESTGNGKWIATGLLGFILGAALFGWQFRDVLMADVLMPPAPTRPARSVPRPPAPPVLPTSEPTAATQQEAGFDIGVALFSTPERATRLESDLVSVGYQASTHAVTFRNVRMFEVRIGPYATRQAADADAARIRELPGYADARVIPRAVPRE